MRPLRGRGYWTQIGRQNLRVRARLGRIFVRGCLVARNSSTSQRSNCRALAEAGVVRLPWTIPSKEEEIGGRAGVGRPIAPVWLF